MRKVAGYPALSSEDVHGVWGAVPPSSTLRLNLYSAASLTSSTSVACRIHISA